MLISICLVEYDDIKTYFQKLSPIEYNASELFCVFLYVNHFFYVYKSFNREHSEGNLNINLSNSRHSKNIYVNQNTDREISLNQNHFSTLLESIKLVFSFAKSVLAQ